MKFRIDTFTLLLLGAIVLASFLPVTGSAADALATTGTIAVALLFFFTVRHCHDNRLLTAPPTGGCTS